MLIYDKRTIKEQASTPVTSGGITQAINSKPFRKFIANCANVYVTRSETWFLCTCMDSTQWVKDGLALVL